MRELIEALELEEDAGIGKAIAQVVAKLVHHRDLKPFSPKVHKGVLAPEDTRIVLRAGSTKANIFVAKNGDGWGWYMSGTAKGKAKIFGQSKSKPLPISGGINRHVKPILAAVKKWSSALKPLFGEDLEEAFKPKHDPEAGAGEWYVQERRDGTAWFYRTGTAKNGNAVGITMDDYSRRSKPVKDTIYKRDVPSKFGYSQSNLWTFADKKDIPAKVLAKFIAKGAK